MKNFKLCLIAAIGLTGLALAGNAANAMPMNGAAHAIARADALVQDVNWVCGPYRCFRQRDYDAPRYYERRSFYGHYDHDRDYGRGYGYGYGYGRSYGYGGFYGHNW